MGDEDRSDELKTKKRIPTTVVLEFSHHHGRSSGGSSSGVSAGGGSGIDVGTPVDGGGVVTAVTPTTVTVEFPGGVPEGPVRLPGSETTVVRETASTDSQPGSAPAGGLPWGGEDDLEVAGGLGTSASEVVQLADALHRRYRLPCPGSRSGSVRLVETTSEGEMPAREVLNVANTGSCPCSIFIAAFAGSGQVLTNVRIDPGEVLPVFRAPPEAGVVAVACSGGCQSEGCVGEVTIAVPVA